MVSPKNWILKKVVQKAKECCAQKYMPEKKGSTSQQKKVRTSTLLEAVEIHHWNYEDDLPLI